MHLPAIARSPLSSIGCPLPSLADVVFPRVQERLANASRSPQAEGLAGVQLLLIEDPLPLTLAQLEGTLYDSNRACSCQPCPVPGWRVLSPLGLVAVGADSRPCAGIAVTATLCAAAGDEKRPVFLALGPKAAEMRQSPGDLVLAFVSLLACSFTVLGYALSSFSAPLHHHPRHPVEPHTSCTDTAIRGQHPASRVSRHSAAAPDPLAPQQFLPTTAS